MMFDVQISEQADKDLRGIFEYIAFELLEPENAAGQLDRLEAAFDMLGFMPEKHRRYEKEPWRSRGLRVVPVDNYLVFYIPDMEAQKVTVIRVMYCGRDMDKELKRHTRYEPYKANKGVEAMRKLSEEAEKNAVSDMTLDEINAEIDAAQREREDNH